MKPKIGLVIQGPLHSPGLQPPTWQKNEGIIQKTVNFDAVDNIAELCNAGTKIFDEVVLVTWLEHLTVSPEILELIIKPVKLVLLKEAENLNKIEAAGNNKRKQILTLRTGLDFLASRECVAFVKVRSDQHLDLSKLRKVAHIHSSENYMYKLGVPYLNIMEVNRLVDFYMVGNVHVISKVFESYLESVEMYQDTHLDYFYSFSRTLQFEKRSFKHQYEQGSETVGPWIGCFYPLPPSIWRSLHWRGAKVLPILDRLNRLHLDFSKFTGRFAEMMLITFLRIAKTLIPIFKRLFLSKHFLKIYFSLKSHRS